VAIPGGVLDTVRRVGGTMITTQSQRISMAPCGLCARRFTLGRPGAEATLR